MPFFKKNSTKQTNKESFGVDPGGNLSGGRRIGNLRTALTKLERPHLKNKISKGLGA
jgi:hypothetical protein